MDRRANISCRWRASSEPHALESCLNAIVPIHLKANKWWEQLETTRQKSPAPSRVTTGFEQRLASVSYNLLKQQKYVHTEPLVLD
jgi:hypothetical protein